jgi:putative SOS response-associated peptidase YedK
MCYYNGISVIHAEFIRLKSLERVVQTIRSKLQRDVQSGFDYADWPILLPINGGKDFTIDFAHWEFVAPWNHTLEAMVENRKKYNTLNAQGEKLLESKLFGNAALQRRCLVLSSGFYEWRHFKPLGAKKPLSYPYFISLPQKEYFFMAGIYQPFTDRSSGETFNTFAIVTTAANSLMQQVHNSKQRMPVILPEDLALEWIQEGLSAQRIQALATYSLPADQMQATSIHKDFRTHPNPQEACNYPELPQLQTLP